MYSFEVWDSKVGILSLSTTMNWLSTLYMFTYKQEFWITKSSDGKAGHE